MSVKVKMEISMSKVLLSCLACTFWLLSSAPETFAGGRDTAARTSAGIKKPAVGTRKPIVPKKTAMPKTAAEATKKTMAPTTGAGPKKKELLRNELRRPR
jgi:hypothetical protein